VGRFPAHHSHENQDAEMSETAQKLGAINKRLMGLFGADKTTLMAFRQLSEAAVRPGTLSSATKELIAVSLAVAKGCEDCIIYHVSEAKKHGAGRAELVEVLAVAIEMTGGPGAVYGAKALEAYDGL
jgi:AhpD family alkylhydroperoxidase